MESSILKTIKKMLGVDPEYDVFDTTIETDINTALMTLDELGVGPSGFRISGNTETWSNFLGTSTKLEGAKSYIYLRCRLLFDPPATSFVLESMSKQIAELEWRLCVKAEDEPPTVVSMP